MVAPPFKYARAQPRVAPYVILPGEGMCELLHTGDVFRSSSGDPSPRGTDGSNPSSSSRKSANFRFLSRRGPRVRIPFPPGCGRRACGGLDRAPPLGFENFRIVGPNPLRPIRGRGAETRSGRRHRTPFSRHTRALRTTWLATADKYRARAQRTLAAYWERFARTTGCPSPISPLSDRRKKLPRCHRPGETTRGSELCAPMAFPRGSAQGRGWDCRPQANDG
jgi:hypothetical protein